MPFTPFHLGPPILCIGLYYLFWDDEIIDNKVITALVGLSVGSVIPDIQGAYAIYIDSDVTLHGFSHTLVGAVIYSFTVTLGFGLINKFSEMEVDRKIVYFSTLGGVIFFHLVPDVLIWSDMRIFWPASDLRFGDESRYGLVTQYLSYAFILGLIFATVGYIRSVIRNHSILST